MGFLRGKELGSVTEIWSEKQSKKRKRQPVSLLPCCIALPFLHSICEAQIPHCVSPVTVSNKLTLMRVVSNAGLVVLMRLAGGETELSRDPVCPSQEHPVQELVAARWGDDVQWSIPSSPRPIYSYRVRPTSSLCCTGHSPIKGLFHWLID